MCSFGIPVYLQRLCWVNCHLGLPQARETSLALDHVPNSQLQRKNPWIRYARADKAYVHPCSCSYNEIINPNLIKLLCLFEALLKKKHPDPTSRRLVTASRPRQIPTVSTVITMHPLPMGAQTLQATNSGLVASICIYKTPICWCSV